MSWQRWISLKKTRVQARLTSTDPLFLRVCLFGVANIVVCLRFLDADTDALLEGLNKSTSPRFLGLNKAFAQLVFFSFFPNLLSHLLLCLLLKVLCLPPPDQWVQHGELCADEHQRWRVCRACPVTRRQRDSVWRGRGAQGTTRRFPFVPFVKLNRELNPLFHCLFLFFRMKIRERVTMSEGRTVFCVKYFRGNFYLWTTPFC